MKCLVDIATDSLRICDGRAVEARTSMGALLEALHHETSAYAHLKDLPMAHLKIEVWPAHLRPGSHPDQPDNIIPFTLNQEAGNC